MLLLTGVPQGPISDNTPSTSANRNVQHLITPKRKGVAGLLGIPILAGTVVQRQYAMVLTRIALLWPSMPPFTAIPPRRTSRPRAPGCRPGRPAEVAARPPPPASTPGGRSPGHDRGL